MRLLLSLILNSIVFLFPHKSEATTAFDKESTTTLAHNLAQTHAAEFSDWGHQTITVFRNINARHLPNQHRWVPGINPDHSGLLRVPVALLLPASRIDKAYANCTPIGLKLLFPKHYFW